MDWTQARSRQPFLAQVVTAARRLLALATALLPTLAREAAVAVQAEHTLLTELLAQDVVERPPSGGSGGSGNSGGSGERTAVEVKEGTARDRITSATDLEQRHGRKSASKTFTGHKTRVAVEPESQLIVDVEGLAGNAGDAEGALAQPAAVE